MAKVSRPLLYNISDEGEVLHFRSFEMLESFNALCDYRPSLSTPYVRGRRLALATTALMSPPMHRRTALKANLMSF